MSLKLYSSPGSCSTAVHIALREAGLDFSIVRVNLRSREAEDGRTIDDINPKGYVPVLELADGQRLTEIPAILRWIADQDPARGLGGDSPYRFLEAVCFVSSEVHKTFSPLFSPVFDAATKEEFGRRVLRRLGWLDGELSRQSWVMGNSFTLADAYLFVVSGWARHVNLDLSGLTHLAAWRDAVAQRPAVQEALRVDGLA